MSVQGVGEEAQHATPLELEGGDSREAVPHALHSNAWLRYSVTMADRGGTSTT